MSYSISSMIPQIVGNCATGLRRMAEQLLTEPDRVAELAAVGLPVHVAYGQRDDAWPPAQQAAMARRLGATETVIPGAGHSPAAEKPVETAAVLAAFWEEIDAEPSGLA
jgi:pimeloyl-ACP methyl ester carboxylesterase